MTRTTSRCRGFFTLVALSLISLPAFATLMTSLANLAPGERYRVLYVTSSLTTASSSSIDYYNAIVESSASIGTVTSLLGLRWKALASTESVNAQDNTGAVATDISPISVFNTAGQLLATSMADLWDGNLLREVFFNENGGAEVANTWTGTDEFGNTTCPLGSISCAGIRYGSSAELDANWISDHIASSSLPLALYGLSDEAVIAHTVPEGSTIAFVAIGMLIGLRVTGSRTESRNAI